MDMWNWLLSCHKEGCLTFEDLEKILKEDDEARRLWNEFAEDPEEFIDYVREQVKPFINYLKKKKL
jgi:hypothetical protein